MRPLKNIYHLINAIYATIKEKFPGRKLIVIGVTGTDGKTTTVNLIYHMLKHAKVNVSMISTIGAIIHGNQSEIGFHVTTPSSISLQKFLTRSLLSNGEKNFMVLEVTSHAIDQERIWGIPFSIGVLTNVTHEHLDYHKTYNNYLKTKAKLLKRAKTAVVNYDDESYEMIKKILLHKKQVITYGKTKKADINPVVFPFTSSLLGDFNTYNILAAIAVGKLIGLSDEDMRNAIASFKAPIGRQEIIHKGEFTVMIDFAHTPNSFKKILPETKHLTVHTLIHVFGCAGKRDVLKRAVMGEIASQYDDIIILTAEDPRGESLADINKEIIKGFTQSFRMIDKKEFMRYKNTKEKICIQIDDRKEAIQFAIAIAQKGDTVLLTGKSHEQSLNYNGKIEEAWDEFGIAREALEVYEK